MNRGEPAVLGARGRIWPLCWLPSLCFPRRVGPVDAGLHQERRRTGCRRPHPRAQQCPPVTPPETVSPELRSPPLCPLTAGGVVPPESRAPSCPPHASRRPRCELLRPPAACAGGDQDAVIGGRFATLCNADVLQGARQELQPHLPNQSRPARWEPIFPRSITDHT